MLRALYQGVYALNSDTLAALCVGCSRFPRLPRGLLVLCPPIPTQAGAPTGAWRQGQALPRSFHVSGSSRPQPCGHLCHKRTSPWLCITLSWVGLPPPWATMAGHLKMRAPCHDFRWEVFICGCYLFMYCLFAYLSFGFFFELGSCYVAWAGLELTVLLPQPPWYWDYRCEPSHPEHFINVNIFVKVFILVRISSKSWLLIQCLCHFDSFMHSSTIN
jgi:hypothetical protein